MEAKAINLNLSDDLVPETDNKFEKFLWKRAKNHTEESIKKEKSSSILNIKKTLTVDETVSSISDEIEDYMVNYLKLMEFSKDHSDEISQFFKKNLKAA